LKGHQRAWERGEIDDLTFERRSERLGWWLAAGIFGPVIAIAVIGRALEGAHLDLLLTMTGILAVIGLALGFRLGRWSRFGAREQIIARGRQRAEANPAEPLVPQLAGALPPQRFFGRHYRSKRWAHFVILVGGGVLALCALLHRAYEDDGRPYILGAGGLFVFLWGTYQRLDRRPYLDISPEGIWSRRWGPARVHFNEIKAVYPRRSGRNIGVVLVPRAPQQLKQKLSFIGRLSLRSGDFGGTATHAGTLTIWCNRLDLPPREFLAALQALVIEHGRG
jgi:hypothetical protein